MGSYPSPTASFGMHDAAVRPFDVATSVVTSSDDAITFQNLHALGPSRELLYETNLPFATLPISLQKLQPPVAVFDDVAYLSNTWPTNFYHWMCLTLPLLRFYESAGIEVQDVYVGDRITGWQERSLELVGIGRERIVTEPCRAKNAHVAISTRTGGSVAPSAIEWVRHSMVGPEPSRGSRRLFVGRGEATTRRLIGEQEIATALEREYGFEYITTADMTLDEEIELFAQTEAIIAPHGAALTNLLFAPRGTQVLELQAFDADFATTTAFLELSCILGHVHGFLRGEQTEKATREISTDVVMSVSPVLEAVDAMLGDS